MLVDPKVAKALRWIDTVPHHRAEWLPRYAEPKDVTKLRLSSFLRWHTIDRATWQAMRGLVRGADAQDTHLFELTEAGKAVLAAIGAADD